MNPETGVRVQMAEISLNLMLSPSHSQQIVVETEIEIFLVIKEEEQADDLAV